MKINQFEFSKSSFLSIPKDLEILVNKIDSNKNIGKLLKCPTQDWQSYDGETDLPTLIREEYIRIIPKVTINPDIRAYMIITFGSFIPNSTNPQFRDNIITIDIMCHFDGWNLGNFEMRPYRIAGEIDALLDGQKLTGIGELHFMSGDNVIYNNEFAGISLEYYAVHGEEDKVNPLVKD